jgi:hypothetical protein
MDLVNEQREIWMARFSHLGISEFDEQVDYCRNVIKDHFKTKLKNVNKFITSYGLKHRFEDLRGKYINNSACIVAFALEGYKFELAKYSIKNYNFNISKKDYSEFQKLLNELKGARS